MHQSRVYEPVLIRALVDSGGSATVRQLASIFVFAGLSPDPAAMIPATRSSGGPPPLNGTGSDAGYPNPAWDIYTVPGIVGGKTAYVAYLFFMGPNLAEPTATKSH